MLVGILGAVLALQFAGSGSAQEEPVSSYLVAEGATHSGFQYYLQITNPTDDDATVDVTFLTEKAGAVAPPQLQGKDVPAGKRETIRVNDFVVSDNVSSLVESHGAPVVVDGSMSRVGSLVGTAFRGVSRSSLNWYFSSGANHSGFNTYIQVANSSDTDAIVDLTVLTQKSGSFTVPDQVVEAESRRTFNMHQLMTDEEFPTDNFSVEVVSTNGVPVVVYGSRDRSDPNPPADDVHAASAAVPSTATRWHLAEGVTHSGFSSYVEIANHDEVEAKVDVELLPHVGPPETLPTMTIAPKARATVRVNDTHANHNVGAVVHSVPNDDGETAGIVVFGSVDRVNVRGRAFDLSSASAGTAAGWISAEGATHSGLSTFVQILNPTSAETRYSVRVLRGNGDPVDAIDEATLPAKRRATVHIGDFVPSDNVSVVVTVPEDFPLVAAELTMNFGDQTATPGYSFSRNTVNPAGRDGTPLGPPDGPENVSVDDHPDDDGTRLDISWDRQDGADGGYHVYRSASPFHRLTIAPVPQVPSGRATFTDTGLTPGTEYTYVVTAMNAHLLESEPSDEASGTPADDPPGEPGTPSATAGDREVHLDWPDNPEDDVFGYHVRRANAVEPTVGGQPTCNPGMFDPNLNFSQITTEPVEDSEYLDETVSNGNHYCYQVQAVDLGGNMSGWSDTSNRASPVAIPPDVTLHSPDGGEVWRGGTKHNITWTATDADDNITTVDLEFSTNGGSTYDTIVVGIENTGSFEWTVPQLESTQARVRVRVHDAKGNSDSDTSSSNFAIDNTAPTAVNVTAPAAGQQFGPDDNITISWNGGADNNPADCPIEIHYTTDGEEFTRLDNPASCEQNDGSFTWQSADVPQITTDTVRVRVTAKDKADPQPHTTSGLSAEFSIDHTPPAAPQIASVNGEASGPVKSTSARPTVEVCAAADTSFAADERAELYSGDPNNPGNRFAQRTAVGGESCLTIEAGHYSMDLPEGVHTLRARHRDDVGNLSTPSSGFVYEVDTTPPGAPTGLTAVSGQPGQVTLNWNHNPEADLDGYIVIRTSPPQGMSCNVANMLGLLPDPEDWDRQGDDPTTPAGVNSYVDPDVESGENYCYRVLAVDDVGNESDPSNMVSATPG